MSPGQYVPQEVRAKCLPAGQGKMSPKIETREKSGQFVPQGNMSSGQFVPQPKKTFQFKVGKVTRIGGWRVWVIRAMPELKVFFCLDVFPAVAV